MNHKHHDDDDDDGRFKRHRWLLPLIVILAIGGIGYAASHYKGGPSAPARPVERMMTITLPPPPPPPPPPTPKVEPPPEEKKQEMIAQEEVKPDEIKAPEPKPSDDPPPIGTNNVGNGPDDGFGLGAYKGGNGGNGNGGGKGNGSKWGWYAGKVQNAIGDALRRNSRTRNAALTVQVKVWADASGRITRAQLAGSTGDAGLDSILSSEVLRNLQLPEAPPQDMPMPINLRITARKSN